MLRVHRPKSIQRECSNYLRISRNNMEFRKHRLFPQVCEFTYKHTHIYEASAVTLVLATINICNIFKKQISAIK